jgi:uncharacterized caspase-like protein
MSRPFTGLAASLCVGLSLFVFSFGAPASIATRGSRFALVVTNEYYPELGNLHFCHSDGQITSSALRTLGFEIQWLKNASAADVRQALSELKRKAEAAGPESVVFFYFSGHAAEDGMRNYLIVNERAPPLSSEPKENPKSADVTKWRQAVLPVIGIPFGEITGGLATLKTKARFVVIDSHLDRQESSLSEDGQLFAAQGNPLLNAADSNNYSLSLSSALLTPGLSVDEIFKRVQVRVAELTNGRQVPFSDNRMAKDFRLSAANNSIIPAAGGGGESETALEEPIWISVKDSKDIQLLRVFLQRFPAGRHAAEAQKQIDESTRLAAIAALQPRSRGQTGRRVALVIGNGAYQGANQLANPVNDARSMAAALKGLGFETVQDGYDLGRDAMVKELRSFGEAAKGADWAVIYYAGHGMEVKGNNYLIPVDAKLADEQDIEEEAVPMSRLLDRLQDVTGIKVIILDACRDSPFSTRMFRRQGSRSAGQRGLAMVQADSGTLIAYATSPTATAGDGEAEHSPYTSALLKHMADPGRDIRLMFGSVFSTVAEETKKKQLPWISAELGGDLYFLNPH